MKELYYVTKVDKGNLVSPSKIRITRQCLMKIWLHLGNNLETFFGHLEYQFLCWLVKMCCRDAGTENAEVPACLTHFCSLFVEDL